MTACHCHWSFPFQFQTERRSLKHAVRDTNTASLRAVASDVSFNLFFCFASLLMFFFYSKNCMLGIVMFSDLLCLVGKPWRARAQRRNDTDHFRTVQHARHVSGVRDVQRVRHSRGSLTCLVSPSSFFKKLFFLCPCQNRRCYVFLFSKILFLNSFLIFIVFSCFTFVLLLPRLPAPLSMGHCVQVERTA